jgi:hypothetical protein
MPKVTITNAKGLVQKTGGGVSLFSATETVTADATATNAPVAATTSLALVSSDGNTKKVNLPAIAGLDVGHTILVASIGTADVVISTPGAETINGAATITQGENTAALIIKSAAATWVATTGV